jgi:LMBR1 domain-containing protein 1
MALNIVLIITSAVFALLLIAAAFYFLIYFQHPGDKNNAYLPKIVVVIGLTLATYNIFILPLDVANQNEAVGDRIDSEILRYITLSFHALTVFLAFFVFPFAKFWYLQTDDEDEEVVKGDLEGQEVKAYGFFV